MTKWTVTTVGMTNPYTEEDFWLEIPSRHNHFRANTSYIAVREPDSPFFRMGSRRGDIPALESGVSGGFFGGFSSSIGMSRRAFSYDEALDAPMQSPPADMCVTNPWKNPLIPQRKFKRIAEEDESGTGDTLTVSACQFNVAAAAPVKSPVPVVKANASSLMNTLMIKHTQESLQRFELQAGLTEAGYTPHKGLSAEETQFHLLAEKPRPKLRMPNGDFKEDRLTTSAQSTPCGTPTVTPCVTPNVSPHTSPIVNRRSWFNHLSPAPIIGPSQLSSFKTFDMGGNEGGGGGTGGEMWNFFGTSHPVVQKSSTDPGSETNAGFTLQSYFGVTKSNTLEGIKTQVNLMVDDPSKFNPPKIELSGVIENKRPPQTRPHKLMPRDMNVLTPSGF
ncbi:hypothetical protein DPEC_G00024650 [Dallia pectoralis]|uniref:Uncharacterized protein n=1 Tax=Dallia pectoralis TaxID=75939 RepID=A0ACC2HI39_DALPE|nr:hypothetical protein DPEC_G00024650 [Dallia pectoralis]